MLAGGTAAHVTELPEHGHEPGATYTAIGLWSGGMRVLYTAPREDLFRLTGTPAAPAELLDRVSRGITVANLGTPCTLARSAATNYDAIGAFQYALDLVCQEPLDEIVLHYTLFGDDPTHRNFVEVVIGGHVLQVVVDPSDPTLEIPVAQLLWARGWTLPDEPPTLAGTKPEILDYLRLGFSHVVTGWDHLAFVLALVLLAARFRDVAITITAFTVAHSLTLGLAAAQVWVVPPVIIEPLIAFSIVAVASENVYRLLRLEAPAVPARGRGLRSSRWLLAFGFGLVHGFGFSYLLATIGLPPRSFLTALAAFNVGVELAQLAVVVTPFLILRTALRHRATYRWLALLGSAAIGLTATLWLVERLRALG